MAKSLNAAPPGRATHRDPAADARPDAAGAAKAGDSVSLTPAAQLLRAAEGRAADTPVVDSQRVSAVRESIANGSFAIDPARIAERMMGMEQALARLQ